MKEINTADLFRLENQISFQEDLLLALNDTVIKLQQDLFKLKEQLTLLSDKLVTLSDSNVAKETDELPPPHY